MANNSIAVFGFGKTGKALLDFLLKKSEFSIYLYNDKNLEINDPEISAYISKGVKFYFGSDGFEKIGTVIRTIVLSPGFNGKDKRFEDLRSKGIRVISEIEFAYSYIIQKNIKIIALTGTNGKSTTVSLIYHFLNSSEFNVILAGNIGNPFISEIENILDDSFVVLELSSFQLEDIEKFKPYISMILNVTPDHLDRYGTMDSYLNAKLNIIKNQNESGFFIYNDDDKILADVPVESVIKVGFSLQEKSANSYFSEGRIIFNLNGSNKIVSLENNPLKGIHNLENIIAAVTAVLISGVSVEQIEQHLKSFKGLHHRMEIAGSFEGVEFINDSKATNVDAAKKSSMSFDNDMVIILGGKDKDGDFRALDNVLLDGSKGILLIGDAQKKIWSQLELCRDKVKFVNNFDEAISSGYEILKGKGGVLLLAPACASFDMFDNFEDRGNKFKLSVKNFIDKMLRGKNG